MHPFMQNSQLQMSIEFVHYTKIQSSINQLYNCNLYLILYQDTYNIVSTFQKVRNEIDRPG